MLQLTKEDYARTEEMFFRAIQREFGNNLSFYCVTGSLAKGTLIPGWSDIDVVLGVHGYSPVVFSGLNKCLLECSGLIKVGVTLYSTVELNSPVKFLDPKSHKTIRDINAGIFTPRIKHESVTLTGVTVDSIEWFDHVDLTKMLHDLKRFLISFSAEKERKIFTLVSVILKVLLNKKGLTPRSYQEIISFSEETLKLDTDLKSPEQILRHPEMLEDRYLKYIEFLKWLEVQYTAN